MTPIPRPSHTIRGVRAFVSLLGLWLLAIGALLQVLESVRRADTTLVYVDVALFALVFTLLCVANTPPVKRWTRQRVSAAAVRTAAVIAIAVLAVSLLTHPLGRLQVEGQIGFAGAMLILIALW